MQSHCTNAVSELFRLLPHFAHVVEHTPYFASQNGQPCGPELSEPFKYPRYPTVLMKLESVLVDKGIIYCSIRAIL